MKQCTYLYCSGRLQARLQRGFTTLRNPVIMVLPDYKSKQLPNLREEEEKTLKKKNYWGKLISLIQIYAFSSDLIVFPKFLKLYLIE